MLLQFVLGRARAVGRRGVALSALMACAVSAGAVVAAPSGADVATLEAGASPLTGFVVQIGPEERVFGPSGMVDFPFFSERTPSGKLVGFISNNDSYRTVSRRNAKLVKPKVILRRGGIGKFDKCGAWLIGSVYKVTAQRWVAAYHAEAAGRGDNNRCIYNDESVVASIGLAESNDGGTTWRKPGYPHNRIITQDRALSGARGEDATMGRLLKMGNYLYLFYGATNRGDPDAKQLQVARSHVNDLGRPGTWFKYFCKPRLVGGCEPTWTEPGLGGRSTPIKGIDAKARWLVPNTFLQHHIAFYASGKKGFRLYVSNNADTALPMSWTGSIPIYPPVSTERDRLVDQWGTRTARSKQLYAYPSVVSVTGDSNTSDQTFYVYYVKLFPGGGFPERYLMRRKIVLSTTSSGAHRVALTTYFSKQDGRRHTSTERPQQASYRPQSTDGYLAGQRVDGYRQVFDCKRRADFVLRLDRCALGESPVRRVGWISPDPTISATVPIYRCYNVRKRNHFASTDRRCLGFRKETRLGFGLPAVS